MASPFIENFNRCDKILKELLATIASLKNFIQVENNVTSESVVLPIIESIISFIDSFQKFYCKFNMFTIQRFDKSSIKELEIILNINSKLIDIESNFLKYNNTITPLTKFYKGHTAMLKSRIIKHLDLLDDYCKSQSDVLNEFYLKIKSLQ